jgi:hypothetical protein
MDKTQYKYETIGTTMVLEGEVDLKTHEELHRRYAQALAESMRNTKDTIMGEILSGNVEKHQIEVNFNE